MVDYDMCHYAKTGAKNDNVIKGIMIDRSEQVQGEMHLSHAHWRHE